MLTKSLSLVLSMCLTATAVAQQAPSAGTGRLAGMVSDPRDVYVPNARIIIRGKQMNRDVWSGDDGTYSVELAPGTYRVRFEHFGFATVRKRVRITRDAVTKLDVTFRLDPKYAGTVY